MIVYLIVKSSHGVKKCIDVPEEILADLTALYGSYRSLVASEEEDTIVEINSDTVPEQGIDTRACSW